MEPLAKSLDSAEKSWTFLDGRKRTAVILESVAIGRGEYRPGWRWSLHVGKQTGKSSAAHIGYVVSGRMAVRGIDGTEITVGPGEAFDVGPGHDAWVLNDEPCVALDFEHLNFGMGFMGPAFFRRFGVTNFANVRTGNPHIGRSCQNCYCAVPLM